MVSLLCKLLKTHIWFRFIAISCATTPWYLAFPESYSHNALLFDTCLNLVFFADIVINFFTAYHDNEFRVIDDFGVIALTS